MECKGTVGEMWANGGGIGKGSDTVIVFAAYFLCLPKISKVLIRITPNAAIPMYT
jgi:hypothetical protein